MLKQMFDQVREKSPLIHNITNYVTVNDCANMVLACGASPIMADDKEEVAEIQTICAGLNINIGTLNSRTIESMKIAGMRANELGHPAVLDPVGVGASTLRTSTANELLKTVKFTVIRGNISEIKTLAVGTGTTKGVDADIADRVTEENLDEAVAFVKKFAERTGQLSALTAAFVTANQEHPLEAAAAAVCAMGLAGEIAHKRLTPQDGNATYRNYIIDAIYHMDGDELERGAKFEVK